MNYLAGLLARGYWPLAHLPSQIWPVALRAGQPLTVAGTAPVLLPVGYGAPGSLL